MCYNIFKLKVGTNLKNKWRLQKMEIKIKYNKKGFGPYSISFNNQTEAYDWIKYNDIEILEIIMG